MSMDDNDVYGDSDFLAQRDKTVHDFRASEKDTKRKIIEKMLTLRHNMKYNKHLLSVYTRAKELFDTMVDEHRSQLNHLDEIYRHLNHLIRENLSAQRNRRGDTSSKMMMTELVKDKKRIGSLLKKMRGSFDKLMDIDTVIGTTIENINEITLMDENVDEDDDEDDVVLDNDESESENDDEDEGEDEGEDEDEDDEDDEDEDDEDEDDEDEDDEDDEDEDEDDEDEDDETESDDVDTESVHDDDSHSEEVINQNAKKPKPVIYVF
jgi:hypothetical protein